MYVLNITLHRHQHVLNDVSGIKEACGLSAIQVTKNDLLHSRYVSKEER